MLTVKTCQNLESRERWASDHVFVGFSLCYVASLTRKQRETNAGPLLILSFLFRAILQPRNGAVHIQVFLSLFDFLGFPSQVHQSCLLEDSKFHQADNQD